jgi:hypothetical protein
MPIQRSMRRRLVVPTVFALAIAVAYGWAELTGYLWTDYELANEVPLRALVHGHIAEFFQTVPIDGPSLLVRAPFAFGAWLWGGSDMAIYRMVAVPGLLAGVILGSRSGRSGIAVFPTGARACLWSHSLPATR